VKRFLLDTNVVSETRKHKPHGAVLAWLAGLRDEQIFLSAVTMGELQAGIELTRRHDREKARAIELWADQLEDSHQILPMAVATFREWGRLMHGKSDQLIENAMIAATARIHDLTVATRNEGDFRHFNVEVLNPFKAAR
jgi:toxin FitB